MLDEDHKGNHSWWEERAALHSETEMYREFISLLRAGKHPLRPLEVHCAFKLFDSMVKDVAGDYRRPPELEGFVPLMFSLRATFPA